MRVPIVFIMKTAEVDGELQIVEFHEHKKRPTPKKRVPKFCRREEHQWPAGTKFTPGIRFGPNGCLS
jgi:hypothetical protein